VGLERIEAVTVVPLDVAQSRLVEEHEYLMVLAPQLAEPLHGQRVGRHDQCAVGPAGVQQMVEHETGLDGLAQPDLVGQQPAYRVAARRALGRVELMREETNTPTEKRPESVGLACRGEVQHVEAHRELLGRVDVAAGEPVGQRTVVR